jgi:hypothetical protein
MFLFHLSCKNSQSFRKSNSFAIYLRIFFDYVQINVRLYTCENNESVLYNITFWVINKAYFPKSDIFVPNN